MFGELPWREAPLLSSYPPSKPSWVSAKQLSLEGLAVRYVGVSAIIAAGVGLLAPTLLKPRPASIYAGVCGGAFTLMAASLVAELQWFIGVAMASVGFPVGWFTFRSEVQGAARFLCGAEESSEHAENPDAKSGDDLPVTDE